ncbi:MAG: 50S ribosomal protein L13 [Armatimonadota bacterium]
MKNQKTQSIKHDQADRDWWIISASGIPLGRLAARVAPILRGKHKPTYTPNADCGDYVVVTDASEVTLTGNKMRDKKNYRASTRPGHLKEETYEHFIATRPEKAVLKAVKGMLPHNALGRKMAKKLKVYAGSEHPHDAQEPKELTL